MSKKDPNKKGFFKEFAEFINKGNALALAIGVILGGAFTAIVTAINVNIISPIIAFFVGDKNLSESLVTVLKTKEASLADVEAGLAKTVGEKIPSIVISWGALIQAIIDFLLIAIILFLIVKIVTSVVNSAKKSRERLEAKKAEEENVEPAAEPAAEAVETIPLPVEDPEDVKLLKEIRDLLKASKEEK